MILGTLLLIASAAIIVWLTVDFIKLLIRLDRENDQSTAPDEDTETR